MIKYNYKNHLGTYFVMLFLLFFILNHVSSRVFRLKHPDKDLFLGGPAFYPFFTEISSSNVFEDEKNNKNIGKVFIKVRDSKNKIWDIEGSRTNLIYYRKHGRKNQLFKAIHLSRDVVAIESALGRCLQYVEKNKRFQLTKCATKINYQDQIFLITDEEGIWKGRGSYEEGWGLPSEASVQWGDCPTCIAGGFGSVEQGEEFDLAVKEEEAKKEEEEAKKEELEEAHDLGVALGYNSEMAKLGIGNGDINAEKQEIDGLEPANILKESEMNKPQLIREGTIAGPGTELDNEETLERIAESDALLFNKLGEKEPLAPEEISKDEIIGKKTDVEMAKSHLPHGPVMRRGSRDKNPSLGLKKLRKHQHDKKKPSKPVHIYSSPSIVAAKRDPDDSNGIENRPIGPHLHKKMRKHQHGGKKPSKTLHVHGIPSKIASRKVPVDSFGNKANSMDHHLHDKFDKLSTKEKKSLLDTADDLKTGGINKGAGPFISAKNAM